MPIPTTPSTAATATSRAMPIEPPRNANSTSATTISATPAASRAYDAQPPLPSTTRTGSIRPVVSSQRSRCASSACRHSRRDADHADEDRPEDRAPAEHRLDQQDAAERQGRQRDRRTHVTEPADPARAPPAAGGALQAGSVGLEPGVGGQHQPQPGVERHPEPAEQGREHEADPHPQHGTPRWRARPAATPPMIGSCASRVARRTSVRAGGGCSGHLASIVTQRQDPGP